MVNATRPMMTFFFTGDADKLALEIEKDSSMHSVIIQLSEFVAKYGELPEIVIIDRTKLDIVLVESPKPAD